MTQRRRVPAHVGLIPDGNRRWAEARGLPKEAGYAAGVKPGLRLLQACRAVGISEVTIYGFTKENVRRAPAQVSAFRSSCVEFALAAVAESAAMLVVGDRNSPVFPAELDALARARSPGDLRVNLLVNYGWRWDVLHERREPDGSGREFASCDIPRIDLVLRWGGRRRLSGFLPLQCAYADLYVVDRLWPEMETTDLDDALAWYRRQDVTIGG